MLLMDQSKIQTGLKEITLAVEASVKHGRTLENYCANSQKKKQAGGQLEATKLPSVGLRLNAESLFGFHGLPGVPASFLPPQMSGILARHHCFPSFPCLLCYSFIPVLIPRFLPAFLLHFLSFFTHRFLDLLILVLFFASSFLILVPSFPHFFIQFPCFCFLISSLLPFLPFFSSFFHVPVSPFPGLSISSFLPCKVDLCFLAAKYVIFPF